MAKFYICCRCKEFHQNVSRKSLKKSEKKIENICFINIIFCYSASFKALVVKATGLAAGKGVFVAKNQEEACHAVDEILTDKKFGVAGKIVIVEELLEGEEVSVLAFTDGKYSFIYLIISLTKLISLIRNLKLLILRQDDCIHDACARSQKNL